MTLFSRTSNPFLPSIRVRVVPFGVVHLSPTRTGSSQVTRSSTAPTALLLTTGRKVPDHTTSPASQSFSRANIGVSRTLFLLVYSLPLPYTTEPCARTRHKSCSSVPKTLGCLHSLSDSCGPDDHHTCNSNTPAHIALVWACEIDNADPRLSYWELPQPSSPIPPFGSRIWIRSRSSFFITYLAPTPGGFLPTPPLILSQSCSLVRAASMAVARLTGHAFRTSPCHSAYPLGQQGLNRTTVPSRQLRKRYRH
ncbi:unnamed protein product [Acanthosepion pharaonis]|uniref:Uncharacterized protein n=1 Tax=Acanthosepion pharaonis TaxID=158019 RepID=A0A812C723_ACAPH|nr:unnamed protein product [Sepia pharaonis]